MTTDAPRPITPGALPASSRLFIGYRSAGLTEQASDSAEVKAQKRTRFFNELGATFMPGTPLMQAPIGLSAYIPAVIDPPAGANLPDEVAAIVYASRPVYDYFRQNSLSRRMYTHSHTAVFDMQRSVAQFPAPLEAPAMVTSPDGEHVFSCLHAGRTVDWQAGFTRVLFIIPPTPSAAFRTDMLARVAAVANHAQTAALNQILVTASERFAALWLHSAQSMELPDDRFGLVAEGCELLRNLPAQPASVIGDSEPGVAISATSAFTFRFERRLELFD